MVFASIYLQAFRAFLCFVLKTNNKQKSQKVGRPIAKFQDELQQRRKE